LFPLPPLTGMLWVTWFNKEREDQKQYNITSTWNEFMITLPLVDMSLGQIHDLRKGCTPDLNLVMLYRWNPFCLVGQLLKLLWFSRCQDYTRNCDSSKHSCPFAARNRRARLILLGKQRNFYKVSLHLQIKLNLNTSIRTSRMFLAEIRSWKICS
jgi:hypothetical protein